MVRSIRRTVRAHAYTHTYAYANRSAHTCYPHRLNELKINIFENREPSEINAFRLLFHSTSGIRRHAHAQHVLRAQFTSICFLNHLSVWVAE